MDILNDDEVPLLLMWTAIVVSGKYNHVKVVVLNNVIPQLVRKRVWNNKDIWAGVVAAVKKFGSEPKSEPTHRAVLGLPLNQLKGVITSTPSIKSHLATLLQRLSAEERHEVVSGEWAGIANENVDLAKKEAYVNDKIR